MVEATLFVFPVRSLRIVGRRKWRWVFMHANGNVLATDGNQGYENRTECREIGERVVSGSYSYQVEMADD